MKRNDLTVGDEYAVALAHGSIKLDRVASYRTRSGRCRLVSMTEETRRGYHRDPVFTGLRFVLVDDFRMPSSWYGQEGVLKTAGTEFVLESGRDVLMPWAEFAEKAKEFDQERAEQDERRAAAEARYDAVREALARFGVEVTTSSASRRYPISAVTMSLDDAESLVVVLGGAT